MAGKRIVAVLGDYYHKPENQRAALEVSAEEMAARMDVFLDPRSVPWDSLREWDVLVMAREGRISPAESKDVWFTPAHELAISEFVRSGRGLVGLHAGLSSYGHDGAYGQTIHGSFAYHPSEHPQYAVRPTIAVHDITRGIREFAIQDEMYFVRVDSARTTVLMETFSPEYGSSAAAWAHAVGMGRVFCFTPGHLEGVLTHPVYRAVLTRGLRWASGA